MREGRTVVAGMALSALLAPFLPGCADPPPAPRADSLVLISLDTVRRDHLPTYGYGRETAPALERLSSRGTVFVRAFAQEVNTNPSHASMLTGLYPHTHGSLDNGWMLPDDQVTLAQMLETAGFRTAAFVSGAPLLADACGLDRGFQTYDDEFETVRRAGEATVERALAWLDTVPDDERYFLFLHLYDAHGPYMPSGEYEKLFRSSDRGGPLRMIPPYQQVRDAPLKRAFHVNFYRDRYDAMIRYQDDLLARLLDAIDPGTTAVAVLSDHGETFDERHWQLDHGGQVFDEQIRIPLVLHVPGQRAGRIDPIVETTDLTPTFLEILEVAPPAELEFQGRSLSPLLQGETEWPERYAFTAAGTRSKRHADRGYLLDEQRRIYSVRSNDWKLIRYPGVERDYLELYDLTADPGEQTDLAAERPEIAGELLEVLLAWRERRATVPAPGPPLSDELQDKLRSLGYVD